MVGPHALKMYRTAAKKRNFAKSNKYHFSVSDDLTAKYGCKLATLRSMTIYFCIATSGVHVPRITPQGGGNEA